MKAEEFWGRTARRIEGASRIDAQRPEIRGVRVGDQRELWREFEPAVAANGYTVASAFEKIFVGGLAPGARVFGDRGREVNEAEEGNEVRDTREHLHWSGERTDGLREFFSDSLRMTLHAAIRGWWHWGSYRIWRFSEITPETGAPSGMADSPARDYRGPSPLPAR